MAARQTGTDRRDVRRGGQSAPRRCERIYSPSRAIAATTRSTWRSPGLQLVADRGRTVPKSADHAVLMRPRRRAGEGRDYLPISIPPSQTSTWPVTIGEPFTRLMIAAAMSSGSDTRSSGHCAATVAFACSIVAPRPCSSHRPVMKPGATALTRIFGASARASAMVRLFTRRFRRGVSDRASLGRKRGHARDVDDLSAAASKHQFLHRPCALERTDDVDGIDALPIVGRETDPDRSPGRTWSCPALFTSRSTRPNAWTGGVDHFATSRRRRQHRPEERSALTPMPPSRRRFARLRRAIANR